MVLFCEENLEMEVLSTKLRRSFIIIQYLDDKSLSIDLAHIEGPKQLP